MTINYSGRRMTCNVDWLSFSVMLRETNPEIICPEGYRMEILPGNNVFRNRMILRNDAGEKLLTCLWCPFSTVINKRIMTVQVANSRLYCSVGIKDACALLSECVEYSFNACSRIDICLDFVASDFQLGCIRKMATGAMYVEKKREGSQFWHENTIKKGEKEIKVRQPHCLSWGSKTSEIKVKLYWKSREQGILPQVDKKGNVRYPAAEKPYIVEEWRTNKMDVLRVWRLEFSLQSSGQLQWDDKVITLDDVASPYWFCRVFAGLLRTRFVVRKNEGKRTDKHNNDSIVKFLEVPFDRLLLKWQQYNKSEPLTPDGEVLKQIRHLLLQADNEVIRANAKYVESLYNMIETMCEVSGSRNYVERLLGKSLYEYFCDIYTGAGEGKHEVIPSLSKSIS